MIIKSGNVVSHSGAVEWGSGKVVEVTPCRATIQFSDGIMRKIASSHYFILQPADPSSYLPPAGSLLETKTTVARKRVKKVKLAVA